MLEIKTAQLKHQYDNTCLGPDKKTSQADWIVKAYFKHGKDGKSRYKSKSRQISSARNTAEMQSGEIILCQKMREMNLYNESKLIRLMKIAVTSLKEKRKKATLKVMFQFDKEGDKMGKQQIIVMVIHLSIKKINTQKGKDFSNKYRIKP